MSGTQPSPIETISEEQVRDFLKENPDFFLEHADVLEGMEVPHDCGSASSLVEYQSKRLRDQLDKSRRRLNQLVSVARQNELIAGKITELTLELMTAESVDQAALIMERCVKDQFEADAVSLWLIGDGESERARFIKPDHKDLKAFENFVDEPKPLCGRLTKAQRELLFNEDQLVGSLVLLPLRNKEKLYGMVAIGSQSDVRFHPGMALDFLYQMSALLSRIYSKLV